MPDDQEFNLSLTEVSNMFKIRYGPKSDNTYNSYNVLLGRSKKSFDWGGKRMEFPVPTSFQGGVGSGTLPKSNVADYESVQFTAKKVYAVAQYDRETVKAASTDRDAFFRGTREITQKTVESWMRNMSRILFGDGTGALGTQTGAATGSGTTGSPYVVTISDATWHEANWEERDFVNDDAGTARYEVVAVDPANKQISLVDLATTGAPATGTVWHMQGSKDNDPQGLKGVCDATGGTKYNVSVGRRWQSFQHAAGGAGITPDLINKTMLGVEKQSGKVPNLIVTSYKQFEKILNQLEDQKRYQVLGREQPKKGKILFEGVEFMSTMGPVGIFPERFCDDDRLYCLNDNFIHIYHRPGFGWFDDDGTIFLRQANEDTYEARYGGYLEVYIAPPFQGVITGLAT